MPYKDPQDERARASRRRHYRANKKQYVDKKRQLRERNRQIVEEAKDVPCADCDKKYPTAVMEFDHVRGGKKGDVSQMVHVPVGEQTLREEIEKCEVVCANCHRLRTYAGL